MRDNTCERLYRATKNVAIVSLHTDTSACLPMTAPDAASEENILLAIDRGCINIGPPD